jgi:signal recognition particle GTPase
MFSLRRSSLIILHYRSSSNTPDFWSKLKKMNVFASKSLTSDDLKTGIEIMREHLITKNVAANVADKICESVSMKLTGTTSCTRYINDDFNTETTN